MRNIVSVLCALAIAGAVYAADYTPVTKEGSTSSLLLSNPTVSNFLNLAVSAQNVTTQQVVTLTATFNILSVTPTNETTTITLANPGVTGIGKLAILAASSAATCTIAIADSGNVALTAAGALAANDTLTLLATATNKWVEIMRADN